MLQQIAATFIPGSSGLAAAPWSLVGVRQTLAGTSALRSNGYPGQFGNALFQGASSLLVVDNSTWPNVIHSAHANDLIEEDVRTNVNDGQCLVVDGPSLVGRVTTGYGPAQRILFGGTLHVTGYTLADDQSVLTANVATLQSQVATLQSTESADASNIAALQAQNTTQATQNASLQTQINALQAQITSLNQQVTILSATSHVGPLQALLAVTSNMLARTSAMVLATPAGFAVGSNLQGNIGHEVFMAAGFAAQFSLSASAVQVASTGPLRFAPSFWMTAVAGGPGIATPAPMQVASGLALTGFALFAQPAAMAATFGMAASAGNLLTTLPGLMSVTSGLAATAVSAKYLAPTTIAASTTLATGTILQGAALGEMDGVSALLAAGSLQQWIGTAATLPGQSSLAAVGTMAMPAQMPAFAANTALVGSVTQFLAGSARFGIAGGALAAATVAPGGPAVDHAGTPTALTGSSPQTISFTVGSVSKPALLVGLLMNTTSDQVGSVSVTWAGTTMQQIASYQYDSANLVELVFFALVNPASGANNFVVSGSTATGYFAPISFSNVNQTAVTSAFTHFASAQYGNATSMAVSATTTVAGVLMVGMAMTAPALSATFTGSSPGTSWFNVSGAPAVIGGYTPATGSSTTMTFTLSITSSPGDTAAIVVNP